MGYLLQAIIGNERILAQHASDFRHARLVPLAQGIAIIPLTDDLYDEIANGGEIDRFEKLSPGVEQWARCMCAVASVAYIEAEFHGGVGCQSAIVWSDGSRSLGPIYTEDAINQVLRLLGVRIEDARDEFDTIGLGQHRDTCDWLAEAKP